MSATPLQSHETLSPWWPRSVVIVMIVGFAGLILMSLRAYQNAVLPKRKGGMFANATAHATSGSPAFGAAAAPGSTALTCRHCGAPQMQAGAFDCKYCGNRMV